MIRPSSATARPSGVGRPPPAALQDAQEFAGADGAGGQAAGDAEQVVPVRADEVGVDLVAGQVVEWAVVGGAGDPPEAGGADVGQAGAELVAE